MTRIMTSLILGLLFSLGSPGALAEEGHDEHPSKGMDHEGMEIGKSGMKHGRNMHDIHAHMKALHDHSKKMEGMTDQKQLAEEMKKHMRMMDQMIEKMMEHQAQSAADAQPAP